jgi:hypothetical protein
MNKELMNKELMDKLLGKAYELTEKYKDFFESDEGQSWGRCCAFVNDVIDLITEGTGEFQGNHLGPGSLGGEWGLMEHQVASCKLYLRPFYKEGIAKAQEVLS